MAIITKQELVDRAKEQIDWTIIEGRVNNLIASHWDGQRAFFYLHKVTKENIPYRAEQLAKMIVEQYSSEWITKWGEDYYDKIWLEFT
jgi:hypothetical protein